MARHPTHLHNRHRSAVGEDNGHLQDGLHAVANLVGGRTGKRLGAVTALQQERITRRRRREALTQDVYLTGKDQRREVSNLGAGRPNSCRIRPLRLLLDGERPPKVEAGDHSRISVHDGFF